MSYASLHAYLSYHLHLCVASNESRGPAELETLSHGAADDGRGSHAEGPLEEPGTGKNTPAANACTIIMVRLYILVYHLMVRCI